MNKEQINKLLAAHAATSYVHRTDTTNPSYGFSAQGLESFVKEVENATIERAAMKIESMGNGTSVDLVTRAFADTVREMKNATE